MVLRQDSKPRPVNMKSDDLPIARQRDPIVREKEEKR